MYKQARLLTALTGNRLRDGDTVSEVCPFCEDDWESQGRPPEWSPNMSFSITRTSDGVVYNCYRAGCVAGRGFIPLTGPLPEKAQAPRPQYDMPNKPLRKLLPEELVKVEEMYGITPFMVKQHGIKVREDTNRLALPLKDKFGKVFGMEFKLFGHGTWGPKVMRDYYHANNGMHWVNVERSRAAYLVESFLDAVRISEFGNAVALLGTNLNEVKVADLQREFDTVYLCLDPDATMKAFKLYEKYSVFFRNFNVVTLSNDPKYLSSDELRKELGIEE